MPLNIISIVIMLGLGYSWLTRGFFSSFLHLVCTIIAGAIAFAAWEPVSYWILESAPTGGFMSFTAGIAWGVASIVLIVAMGEGFKEGQRKNTKALGENIGDPLDGRMDRADAGAHRQGRGEGPIATQFTGHVCPRGQHLGGLSRRQRPGVRYA